MKTLFLSDLDGTLIGHDLAVPPDSAAGIHAAIARGDGFAAATARTPATVSKILAPIRGMLPAIVMNGAGIFDFEKGEYLCLRTLSLQKEREVRGILGHIGVNAFLYTVKGSHIDVYYREPESMSQRMFREVRTGSPYKTFVEGEAPDSAQRLFFCAIESEERTARMAEELAALEGIRFYRYRDVHDPENWYVEIYDAAASKAAGVRFLRERYGFDRVVAFGDNLNDLPLFEAADEGCAVANAVPALKEAATGVLEEADTAAVGRFIGRYGG